MKYFSYNDFFDCIEEKNQSDVQEETTKYHLNYRANTKEKEFIEKLKNKRYLIKFLRSKFNIFNDINIEQIVYYNYKKEGIIAKIKNKELFIFIKVIEKVDYNIGYKMLEDTLDIMKKWEKEEKAKNKRYPIVIPILVYLGKQKWKEKIKNQNQSINIAMHKNNKVIFSYNFIKIENSSEINNAIQ